MSILLIVIINCSILLTSSYMESELNLEEFFKESHCIPEPSENFLSQYISKNAVQSERSTSSVRNYRSEVNLLVQFNKIEFAYNVESEEGPVQERIFNISLELGDETFYGSGKSKKEAKEKAAKEAIENTTYKKPLIRPKDIDVIDENSPPTVILNNLGLKHGYQIHYYMVDPVLSNRVINLKLLKEKSQFTNSSFWKEVAHLDEPPKSPFSVEVDVDGQSFFAKAHTIQSAKHDAAMKAIKYLKTKGSDKSSLCTTEGKEVECAKAKAKLKSPISILYEYAQKRRLSLEFNELERSGPAHKLIFEMECTLGPEKISAKGRSKKEAKRIAAEKMIEIIPDLDLPTDLNVDPTSDGTTKLKGGKRKASKTLLDDTKDALNNMVNFFSSGDESAKSETQTNLDDEESKKSKKKKNSGNDWSPMEKLAETGKALNLNVQFHTMPRKKSGFYSILSLDLNPSHICLGIGSNIETSQEYAALNGLKFLHKLDVLEGVEENDLDIARFSFDNYIWLTKEHTEEL
ncbi:double-stranded RNA-binding protein Staufen homolog 2-like [Coccinella septempunctata]|uniref:double-stranded RNA-binding protein Staufen homolog 2-like n=1 Tax=Coccinella septempunctata TaxID=41139 RepID=UPI001D09654A|nr:double-stranded RNA-binding protein Staufen homolog 2-like [Coccinella septempunctata]